MAKAAALPKGSDLQREEAAPAVLRPLVVDLDGPPATTDLVLESVFAVFSANPLAAFGALRAMRDGMPAFGARLAAEGGVEIGSLRLSDEILAFVRARKALGHEVYLASASGRRHVEAVAGHLGLFDGFFFSEDGSALDVARKTTMLCDAFGDKGFDYLGHARLDADLRQHAAEVFLAQAAPGPIRRAVSREPEARSDRPALRDYARALRVHQWLKNLLIFVPAAAAHAFGEPLLFACLAFVSFSLCASSVYVLNDLLDLRSDREHPSKRFRAFASGRVPLLHGVALCPTLLAAAVAVAAFLPPRFMLVLALYYALTLAYSVWLKRQMLIDVVTLACLYGVRLLAGGAAVGVLLSPWLGALSLFLFLSLALIKRCTELGERERAGRGDPPGRGYRLSDLPVLQGMAAASGYLAVLVLALYFNSPAVTVLYGAPTRLWLICVVALYWISRVLLLSHRGEMHDDPVVFAATDRVSQLAVLLTGAVVLISL